MSVRGLVLGISIGIGLLILTLYLGPGAGRGVLAATTGTLTVTADTVLTDDHLGNIVIAADNVTLDCQGHAITGAGSGTGIRLSGRTGVRVQNCTISNFRTGVLLDSSSGNTLHKNDASDNTTYGIRPFNSNDNVFKSNVASGNGRSGFFLTLSSDNILKNNSADGNGVHGFRVSVSSDRNELKRNTANGNTLGFDLFSTDGNTLKMNEACGNTMLDLRHRASTGTTFVKNDFCVTFGLP